MMKSDNESSDCLSIDEECVFEELDRDIRIASGVYPLS